MPRVIIDPKGPMEEISEPTPDFTVGKVKARKTKGLYCCDRVQCCFLKRKKGRHRVVLILSQVLYKCYLSVATVLRGSHHLTAPERALRLGEVKYLAKVTQMVKEVRGDQGVSGAQDLTPQHTTPHHTDLPTKDTQEMLFASHRCGLMAPGKSLKLCHFLLCERDATASVGQAGKKL